ncbi:MAG TPA: hypothetical protein VGX37_11750 [Allosphingosinicella sp.]|nr:hypothetical protein [Allosphingosinicella sp.]
MTLQINGTEIGHAIEIASIVGTIVAILISALVVYLLVRPPRRARRAEPEPEAIDSEELLALIDRMERRLEVLERALGERSRTEQLMEAGEAPRMRRTK